MQIYTASRRENLINQTGQDILFINQADLGQKMNPSSCISLRCRLVSDAPLLREQLPHRWPGSMSATCWDNCPYPPSLLPSPHLSASLHIPKLPIIHTQPFCPFCEPASEQKTLNPIHRQPERRLTCPKPCSTPSWSRRQLIFPSLYPIPLSHHQLHEFVMLQETGEGPEVSSVWVMISGHSQPWSAGLLACVAIVCLETDLKSSLLSCKSNNALKGP